MPSSGFNYLLSLINKDNRNECDEDGGVYYCNRCSADGEFEPLLFSLGGYEVSVRPNFYLQYDPWQERCAIMIKGIDSLDHLVLGDPFLQPFVQVYDMAGGRIGLTTHGGEIEEYIRIAEGRRIRTVLVVISAVFPVIILVACGSWYLIRKRRR